MNTYTVDWRIDGNNRVGTVAFLTDGAQVDDVNIYSLYETPFRCVIGAEHNAESIYESAYNGNVDASKNEIVLTAVNFYEGYSQQEWLEA